MELVVIDGASRDGTLKWLMAHKERISRLVSEPDNGVYAAMNKGIRRATGEWIIFLGADDALANDAVGADVASSLRSTSADVVSGVAAYRDGRVYRPRPCSQAVRRNFLHHQATFYRRTIFQRLGLFDERLRVMADYDFNLRAFRHGQPILAIPQPIAACGTGGLSDAGRWLGYREEVMVRHRHFPWAACLVWDVASVVRCLRKRILRRRAAPTSLAQTPSPGPPGLAATEIGVRQNERSS